MCPRKARADVCGSHKAIPYDLQRYLLDCAVYFSICYLLTN